MSEHAAPDASASLDLMKRDAAYAACALIEDKMRVGLGTGSTAAWVVRKLGERIAHEGIGVTAVATSRETERLAARCGVPLRDVNDVRRLDIAIDGADEVRVPGLDLIKGHGGALLREKIVARLTDNFVVAADQGKIVSRLGAHTSLPVEVARFGFKRTRDALESLGVEKIEMKRAPDGADYLTDNGNYIFNCRLPRDFDARAWAPRLESVAGVVEHGLFLGDAVQAFVAGQDAVDHLRRR